MQAWQSENERFLKQETGSFFFFPSANNPCFGCYLFRLCLRNEFLNGKMLLLSIFRERLDHEFVILRRTPSGAMLLLTLELFWQHARCLLS